MAEPQRFEAVESDPGFDEAMRHQPNVPSLAYVIAAAGMFTFTLLIAIAGLALLFGFPAPIVFKVLWVGFTGVFVALGLTVLVRAWRYHSAPIARCIGVVVGTRTQVAGSGSDGSTSTSYFVTLEDRSGARTEYHAHGHVMGLLAPGDIGVAYLKSRTLVGFRRFAA